VRVYHNSSKQHPYWVRLTKGEMEALLRKNERLIDDINARLVNAKDHADGK
jgi:hypothetical protein